MERSSPLPKAGLVFFVVFASLFVVVLSAMGGARHRLIFPSSSGTDGIINSRGDLKDFHANYRKYFMYIFNF